MVRETQFILCHFRLNKKLIQKEKQKISANGILVIVITNSNLTPLNLYPYPINRYIPYLHVLVVVVAVVIVTIENFSSPFNY